MTNNNLLFDIKEHQKKKRTTFESVINRKDLSWDDMDDMFNEFS